MRCANEGDASVLHAEPETELSMEEMSTGVLERRNTHLNLGMSRRAPGSSSRSLLPTQCFQRAHTATILVNDDCLGLENLTSSASQLAMTMFLSGLQPDLTRAPYPLISSANETVPEVGSAASVRSF